jgi:uncharacterized protein
MELTLQRPGEHHYVHSLAPDGIRIVDTIYPGPVIVSANELIADWPAPSVGELTEEQLHPLFDLSPEIVILGTGPRQLFPTPELMMCFYRRGMGIEAMTTRAACRTFNVLVSERRNVAAVLYPLEAQSIKGSSR